MKTEMVGYDYGKSSVPRSPVTMDDLRRLQATVMFGDDDVAALRQAGRVLADEVEDILDVWYGFVASNPHLVAYFSSPEGQPIQRYLNQVRGRFGRWILDTCERDYDQAWLDYQQEIALRHTREKKNATDGVDAPPLIPLRYVVALLYPITSTIRPFLAKKGASEEEVDRMHRAWTKSVTMQVALWARAYTTADTW